MPYIDAITKWIGTGTPQDPIYPKPPNSLTLDDIASWKVLSSDPLYVRFFLNDALPAEPPPPPSPVPPPASGLLIADKDVASDAAIREAKIQFNPLTGHRHDGSQKGGAKISYRSLRDIPQILKDLEAGNFSASGLGGGGGITGSYVSTFNGASGDVLVDFAQAAAEAMGTASIGLPSDGAYAGAAGLAGEEKVADAFDKVDDVLARLMPLRPARLDGVALAIDGPVYSARQAGFGLLRANVSDALNPVIKSVGPFSDGDKGTLSALIDGHQVGLRALSPSDDSGLWNRLRILSDSDPYVGQFGKQGFYKQLTAQFDSDLALTTGGTGHACELVHSQTGRSTLTFFLDRPLTPTVTLISAVPTASAASRHVSGVPSLAAGDKVKVSFRVSSAVSDFYHPTRLAGLASVHATAVDAPMPATSPLVGADVTVSNLETTLLNGIHTENVHLVLSGYNSKGTQGSLGVDIGARLDSKSDESNRIKSGTGGAPTRGTATGTFGEAFDPAEPLTTVGNEELQMLGGVIRYPSLVNYSTNLPFPGPDYSGLQPGSYQNMRWYTVKLGEVSDLTGVILDLAGATNFGATPLIAGALIQVRVDGLLGTGWLNANAAYPGVGSPSVNGEPALVYSQSTATRRTVTFGSTVRTGTLYVRLGLPAGSNKSFTGISRV